MKKTSFYIRFIYFLAPITLFILGGFALKLQVDSDSFKNYDSNKSYKVYALNIPDTVDFAGEKIPLFSPDLRERMDRELLVNTYWQSNTLLLIKRANKYFPQIERILKEEGIPDDFKYLTLVESGLQNVTSPSGAKGFWQIMKNTGLEMGLEINSNVDERYNLFLATKSASKYLKKAKNKFGTWTLAAASYNRGISGIQRNLNFQGAQNYYDLRLGSESSRYIFRILALKEILENPIKYGYVFDKNDLYNYVPVRYVLVDTPIINLSDFAKKLGINYKVLKIHNSWLRQNHLNNRSRKKYNIEIPLEGYY
ncbi:MAG: lytic transglycosylase domain-containing protein [Bacteroidota bacterium]|nr:lytic transglycosylase domain-containing protein [Bacteroidota bacterium]